MTLIQMLAPHFPYALRTHEGRSGIPGCSSGRMPRTVTVPPVTVVLIRARKVPDTLPTRYSVVAFAVTAIVVNVFQTMAPADPEPGAIGLFWGQHSIVIAPPVTDPLPVILSVTSRGSGKTSVVTPLPVVAFTCNAVVTFSKLIVFSFL